MFNILITGSILTHTLLFIIPLKVNIMTSMNKKINYGIDEEYRYINYDINEIYKKVNNNNSKIKENNNPIINVNYDICEENRNFNYDIYKRNYHIDTKKKSFISKDKLYINKINKLDKKYDRTLELDN